MANNNHKVKVMLTLDDRKRFTAFVQLLITIDRQADQARDKQGRYASSKQEEKTIKSKRSQSEARKKAGLFHVKFFTQHLYLSPTVLSLMHRDKHIASWDKHDRYYCFNINQRYVSYK